MNRSLTFLIARCGLGVIVCSSPLAAQDARQNREQAFAAADQAWCEKKWSAVGEVLAPVAKDAGAPPQWRSLAHLRGARSWLAEGKFQEAARAFDAIASNNNYPKVHRDEAVDCRAEAERLAKGLSARDPEATRVRLPALPKPGRLVNVAPNAGVDGDGSKARPFDSLEKALEAVRAAGPVSTLAS